MLVLLSEYSFINTKLTPMLLFEIIPILLTLGAQPECDSFGMCILEKQTESSIENCLKYDNCIQAEMDYISNEIVLIVSQSKIKDKAFIKYFTKENFELDQSYTIPNDLAISIGCQENTIIPKGKYPINEENGKIVVRFKL